MHTDKCCGAGATWSVTGSGSCNNKLYECVQAARPNMKDSDSCGGDVFNDELDVLGSMPDKCCGEDKGATYDGHTCGSTTSPPSTRGAGV